MKLKPILLILLLGGSYCMQAATNPDNSFYTQKPTDADAVYFTPENFSTTADGKTDVSGQLQLAINQLKKDRNFGILFIPEGTYSISKTIYIPPALFLDEKMEKHCSLLENQPCTDQ